MIEEKNQNKTALNSNQQTNKDELIVFDSDIQDLEQFYSQYSSQINKDQVSVISDETEKRKQQARQKFNLYLKDRESLGLKPQKKNQNFEDQDLQGALIDELDQLEGQERFNSEIQNFILMFQKKPQNAINQYIRRGVIKNDDPNQIAAYLIKVQGLDKKKFGEYLGKNKPQIMKILYQYCLLLKFQKIQFDIAIRTLLGKFLLPGQAQQIQRIIWEFSKAYYEANKQDYDNVDQLFPLSYAIIMLATDAHNPKQQRKMTKQQFITNTQRPCPSMSSDYLSKIYDRITKQKFQTEVSYIEKMIDLMSLTGSLDLQGMLKITKDLMKGDVFLKVCRKSNKFAQRKVYLTQDQKRIQWINDPEGFIKQEPRYIEIKDIVDLTLGINSAVMKKSKVPKQFDSLCFTIQTKYRTLDLKAKSQADRAKWVNYLRTILIQRREKDKQQAQIAHESQISRQRIEQIWNTDIFPNWDRHWDYKKKRPKQKNMIVRGLQAICCCFPKTKNSENIDLQLNTTGLHIKTSLLDTLWGLGLPPNSRKTLWPLVIGNNLAYTPSMVQDIRKKVKCSHEFEKLASFSQEAIQMAEIARHIRPDLPAIRDLLVVSKAFLKAIPKNSNSNPAINFINTLHMHHFLAFYRGDKTQIDLRVQLFDYLITKNAPGIKQHFQGIKLDTKMYLVSWFLSAFTDCFSDNDDFSLRIWDNFILEGQLYLFKVGITIIKYYYIELKMCTFHQGLKILRFPKGTSQVLFFDLLDTVDVRQQNYNDYVQTRKHAIIKTKVQAIPLQ